MRVATEIGAPRIEVQSAPECYTLRATLDLANLPPFPPPTRGGTRVRLGLSAVIEETSGRKSYWALAHPPGKPDFHHADCFAFEFSASVAAMKFGIDRLIAEPALRAPLHGRRVALLAHPASVTADLTHSLDALAACGDIKLAAAFGPQHGLRGDKQDNMIELPDFNDPVHGIPVFSLYGEVRKPTDAMMDYLRRHPRRSAGPGLPDLYVHHDAALRARSGGASTAKRCGCWTGPIRSAGRSKA